MSSLEKKISDIVTMHGAKLYDTEIVTENDNTIFRVYITKDSGVDLDLCAEISNDLSPLLDIDPPISGQYYLEVSSPGIERRLDKPSHFQNAIDERVKLKLSDGSKIKAKIVSADDDSVTIINKDGEQVIQYSDIRKAKTYFDW